MDHPKFLLVLNGVLDPAPPEDTARVERDRWLHSTASWTIFRPLLTTQRDLLQVERTKLAGQPLTLALAVAGAKHDAFGRAFWHGTAMVIEDPGASEDDRAAAIEVRQVFLPTLQEINLSTAAEINNARARAPKIEAWGAKLDRIPAAGGRTARHLIQGMVDAAEERARLINERASQPSTPLPPSFALQTAIGVFFDFRSTLAREIQGNPALPRDLETQVFALFDRLRG